MRNYYLVLMVVTLAIFSCEKDEAEENTGDAVATKELPLEYFRAEIDGRQLEAKDTALIAGTAYPSYNTGVINFDFSAWMKDETAESEAKDIYDGFMFKVCFYDGPGTYYTGTDKTVSWAMYWEGFELWENHYENGNPPGIVTITAATEDFVEGTFEFEAYNRELENTVYAVGEFGLKLESHDQYQKSP